MGRDRQTTCGTASISIRSFKQRANSEMGDPSRLIDEQFYSSSPPTYQFNVVE